MSGNFFNTKYDAVDYLTAHILIYLVAGLNDKCSHLSVPLLFAAFGGKFFFKESPNKVVTWVSIGTIRGVSSVHMRNDQ
jgi:hypothetical protein